jgi:hypothetical protein
MSGLCCSLIWTMSLCGQGDDAEDRLRFFKEQLDSFSLFRAGDATTPLALKPDAVLHYSNPESELSRDGVTFLWLAGARPVAAISLSIRNRPANAAYYECTSFSDQPLDCRRNGSTIWAPKKGGLLAQPFSDAPAPADSASRRMTQMRNFARRFTVTRENSEGTKELRLQDSPLYRFSDEGQGILDGALFNFVVSNDPELLVLIEAAGPKNGKEARWQYSIGRMSSPHEVVRLDDKEIWSVPNYHRDPTEDRKTGPYVEAAFARYVPSANAAEKK